MSYGPKSMVDKPVMEDVRRTMYDLSHLTHKVGAIGSLQTLSCIEVVAGDSFKLNASFVFRMSPLRRNLYMDAQVDLFAFYVPHRHIYAANAAGSRWEDFIKAGFDEGVTLGTDTLAVQTANNYNCFGYFAGQNTVVPRWLDRGYVQIWNNYFRDPSDTAKADTYFTATPTAAEANYGLNCCNIKRMWNTAIPTTLTAADYSLPLSGGEVDLYQLSSLKGRLKTETRRDWYATRYRDILNNVFDSQVNTDADQRPTLIMRTKQWLSGIDVNGTDEATLGQFTGKAASVCKIGFPERFFPEHGCVWIMGLVRFPAVIFNEQSYLMSKTEPTYAQIAGDPDVVRRTAPITLNMNEICQSGPNLVVGSVPYAQWYREHSHLVHEMYFTTSGHPFLNLNNISTRNGAVYIVDTQYDDVFATLQLKHWNAQGFVELSAKRFIPEVNQSIFAGTE